MRRSAVREVVYERGEDELYEEEVGEEGEVEVVVGVDNDSSIKGGT